MLKFCSSAYCWTSPKSLSYPFYPFLFIPLKWTPPIFSCVFVFSLREPDGQASGGNDFGSDDWIFTIREKDPKKLQNGASPTGEEVGDRTWLSCWGNSISVCDWSSYASTGAQQEALVPESVHRHHSSLNRGRKWHQ